MVLTDDGVGFPISESAFASDNLWPLSDAATARELATAIIVAVAFASLFPASEVEMEISALGFVGVDVLINALVADGWLAFEGEATGDLLWAPLLAQESVHLCPSGGLDARLNALALTRGGQFSGLFGALAMPPAVTLEFARDGGLVDAEVTGNLTLAMVFFLQGVNLVSLFAGQLRVAQSVLLLTWRLKQHGSYRSWPITDQVQKLHLLLESKDGNIERVYQLSPGKMCLIGSSPENTIILSDSSVSEHCACIMFVDGKHVIYEVTDEADGQISKSDGIRINGEQQGRCILSDGCEITLGRSKFIYRHNNPTGE